MFNISLLSLNVDKRKGADRDGYSYALNFDIIFIYLISLERATNYEY